MNAVSFSIKPTAFQLSVAAENLKPMHVALHHNCCASQAIFNKPGLAEHIVS